MNFPQRVRADFAESLAGLVIEQGVGYGGDVEPTAAYQFLLNHPALLVDVRSQPEWQFTGTPTLAATMSTLLLISWKIYPQFVLNPQFMDQLCAAGATPETPIFFLCRTGGRSTDAAIAATAAGFQQAFNIAGGFEGDINERGQRGTINGWKAAKLPWEQK